MSNRVVRAYLNRHARRLFAGTDAGDVPTEELVVPAPASRVIERTVQKIASARRPLLIVGSQAVVDARQATATAQAIDRIGMPVYLSGMARGLLGPSHPLHRRHQRRKAIQEADLVLLAGVPSDFRLDYGRHVRRKACLISANRSRTDLNRNRRPDFGTIADAGLFLRQLASALASDTQIGRDEWVETLLDRDAEREAEIDRSAETSGEYINPVALLRSVDAQLPDDSVIVADGGDFVATASYIVKPRAPLCWLDPGVFGTLGCGAGFALGAGLCRPGHEIWTMFGDGSVGYALAEFDTFVRHRIPVIAVVGNDAAWAQIAREQVKMLDDDVGTVLARSDYHDVVTALGGHGILLKHGDQIHAGLQEARDVASKGLPVLVNAWLDKTDFREGSLSM